HVADPPELSVQEAKDTGKAHDVKAGPLPSESGLWVKRRCYNRCMSEVFSFRAVLFDFDGTLADSYAAIAASVNHVRAAHSLPPLLEAEVRPHIGRGLPHLLE